MRNLFSDFLFFLENWLYLRSKDFSFANEDGEVSE